MSPYYVFATSMLCRMLLPLILFFSSLTNHTELKHSKEVLDTDTCTCTPAGNLQNIPRSTSTHSLKSTSTVSDSKPDLIKSTRHKHLNEFASTDKCTLSFELRQNATEVQQRPLSWGDEPVSWISKVCANYTFTIY